MLLGIQLVGLLFGLLMLYMTFVFSKKGDFTSREWVVWSGMWVSFLALVIFPNMLNPFVGKLELVRKMDLFISMGIMSFAAIIFYTYSVMRSNQKKLEDVTREVAFLKEQSKEVKK